MRLGREVAIKVLPAEVASSPDRLARFEREARTVAGLNHRITSYNVCYTKLLRSAMADSASGYRRVAQLGNAQERTSWTVKLSGGEDVYYWSVQAVDGAYAGSPFASEESVSVVIVGVSEEQALPARFALHASYNFV